jgi:S1-C subfamily serine protease
MLDGLRIERVIPGSVAETAGLATDDRILEAAGRPLDNAGDLIAIIRRQLPGSWLPIKVGRGAETLDMVAKFPP